MEAFASKNKGTKSRQLNRACLHAPFDFTVLMRCRDLIETEVTLLKDALSALGTLGGMGARSSKGYGSLAIQALRVNGVDQWSRPNCASELRDAIKALAPDDGTATLPEFTALSRNARHVLLSGDKNEAVELLDLVGRELVRFRSWGRNGRILGGSTKSERNFTGDHDLMKSRHRNSHPERIAFGLPHNYGKPADQQVGPFDKELDRRASPLFIHIHECGNTFVAILSFLPARFLPKGKSDISVGRSRVPQRPEDDLYRPIHKFLDRLLDSNERKEKRDTFARRAVNMPRGKTDFGSLHASASAG